MSLLRWEKDGNVAILYMTAGNFMMDLDWAQAMMAALDEIEADKAVQALVVASEDEKNFSQGINTTWLMGLWQKGDTQTIKAFIYRMNDVFKRFLTYPVPVIAAIGGHAYGNGAIMSCAMDFRFMRRDKGFFCFPEMNVSIPFLPGMIAFCRKAVPEPLFNYMALSAQRMTAEQLAEHRAVVKACSGPEDLMQSALDFARTFEKKRGIFAEMKRRMHKALIEVIEKEDPEKIEALKLFILD